MIRFKDMDCKAFVDRYAKYKTMFTRAGADEIFLKLLRNLTHQPSMGSGSRRGENDLSFIRSRVSKPLILQMISNGEMDPYKSEFINIDD